MTVVVESFMTLCAQATLELESFGELLDATIAAFMEQASSLPGMMQPALTESLNKFAGEYIGRILVDEAPDLTEQRRNMISALGLCRESVPTVCIQDKLVNLQRVLEDTTLFGDMATKAHDATTLMASGALTPTSSAVALSVTFSSAGAALYKLQEIGLKAPWMERLLKSSRQVLSNLKAHLLKQSQGVLKSAVEELKPVAGADDDGQVWAQGLTKGGPMGAMLKHAMQTLMKSDCPKIKKLQTAAEAARSKYLATLEVFQLDPKNEEFSQHLQAADIAITRAKATVAEAILVDAFTRHASNPVTMKNISRAQLKKAEDGGYSDIIFPDILGCAEAAKDMMLTPPQL